MLLARQSASVEGGEGRRRRGGREEGEGRKGEKKGGERGGEGGMGGREGRGRERREGMCLLHNFTQNSSHTLTTHTLTFSTVSLLLAANILYREEVLWERERGGGVGLGRLG